MDIVEATKRMHEISTVVLIAYNAIFLICACNSLARIVDAAKMRSTKIVRLRFFGFVLLALIYIAGLFSHNIALQMSSAIVYACWQFGEDILSAKLRAA